MERIIRGKTPPPAAAPPRAPVLPATDPAPTVNHVVIDDGSAGQRLDNFLVKLLKGVPKTHVYRVIRSGEVRVNKGRADAGTRLEIGDDVRVPPIRTSAHVVDAASIDASIPGREFPIVFEDDALLVIDKPAGVAVHGGSGVSFGVIEQLRRARPAARYLELVHRLDKETSGLLMIAKTRPALLSLQNDLRERNTDRAMRKKYSALVSGVWPSTLKVIDSALHKFVGSDGERRVKVVDDDHDDGRRSITLVRVDEPFAAFTLLDVTLKTGRTHQIRVHTASQGMPVVGDPKYGDFELNRGFARGAVIAGRRFDRMFLHARQLKLTHPTSGESLTLEAPLPIDCLDLLQSMRTRKEHR